MTQFLRTSTVLALALGLASVTSAQSLAEVAKKEEARRQALQKTSKVYTNDSLRSEPGAPATPDKPPAEASAAAAAAAPKPPDKPAAPDAKKTEAYWRERITAARNNLERTKLFNEALQTRVNSLSNDWAARDDPGQRAQISADRQKALTELERTKKEIADLEKEIKNIEEEARKAGVPPGWLR